PTESGEDTFVRCPNCGYAANVEAVHIAAPEPLPVDGLAGAGVHAPPDTPTIATLVDLLNFRPDLARPERSWTAADTLKNVVVMLRHPDGTREPLAIGVPGDRDVDIKRLEAGVVPAEVEPFNEDDFARYPALAK